MFNFGVGFAILEYDGVGSQLNWWPADAKMNHSASGNLILLGTNRDSVKPVAARPTAGSERPQVCRQD